jgi:hypothetical protein
MMARRVHIKLPKFEAPRQGAFTFRKEMDTMITLRRMKDTTRERLIGLVDDTEVISVERTVFEPLWKVTQQLRLPDHLTMAKEYSKCINDIVFAAEASR